MGTLLEGGDEGGCRGISSCLLKSWARRDSQRSLFKLLLRVRRRTGEDIMISSWIQKAKET